MSRYSLVTFDAYSGLADFKASLIPALERILGLPAEAAGPLLQAWRGRQLQAAALSNALGGERVSFRACTEMALDHAARHYDLALDAAQRRHLVDAWYPLEAWPEADRVLTELKGRGYALAILSNGDRDMLEALAGRLSVPFDRILSSEECGAYKPDPRVYALPETVLGVPRTDYLHVAGGANDVIGAKAAGVACYWNNRDGETVLYPQYAADFEAPDLSGLLDVL